jgi:predicted O-linked N-acetylglucosamine transferase (SPINDLY family)
MSRGIALIELERRDEALASFDRVLAIEPANAHALNNRGFVLNALDRRDEALASYEQVLRIDPRHAEALINRGVVLSDLGQYEVALRSYEQALAIVPDHVVVLCNRAKALFTLNRFKEALASVERALAINTDHVEALFTRGNVLMRLDRHEEAAACYERVLALNPEHRHARATLTNCRMTVCDWPNLARIERELVERIEQDRLIVSPLVLCGLPINQATFLKAARSFVEHEITRVTPLPRKPTRAGKIKLAYLSADFRRHPVAMLLAELIELHDRDRFEVHGVSIGADDRSDIRARMVRAFDQFHDVAGKGDREIARFLHDLGVDIVIDLGGHTDGARPNILAYRPAPIQVSYIGFLGTMGAPFIDYLIADEVVVPRGEDAGYSERVVRLPECFQVNDAQRKIAPRVPSRGDVGLPENAFVFCCFNANYKIQPPTFDIWMRLLHTVDNSVFWLFKSNDAAANNLRREAAARGIDPARLIFAPRANPEDHLARHALADIFLDTQPINAGATASDALWAGLPIVTSIGGTFLGRVSASLLRAVGLPELVTENRAEYEALALRLARDPAMLKAIRQKLANNRLTKPLFNTDRFRRHIEAAYSTMVEIWQRGEAPRAIDVAPP